MDKVITISDARKIIDKFIKQTYDKLNPMLNNMGEDSVYRRQIDFQNFLVDLICYKWAKADPDMFLKCYVTDESYDTLTGAGYTWYMTFKNKANMNNFLHMRKCTDVFTYREDPDEIYCRRYKIALEIAYTQNILFWLTQNIRIE